MNLRVDKTTDAPKNYASNCRKERVNVVVFGVNDRNTNFSYTSTTINRVVVSGRRNSVHCDNKAGTFAPEKSVNDVKGKVSIKTVFGQIYPSGSVQRPSQENLRANYTVRIKIKPHTEQKSEVKRNTKNPIKTENKQNRQNTGVKDVIAPGKTSKDSERIRFMYEEMVILRSNISENDTGNLKPISEKKRKRHKNPKYSDDFSFNSRKSKKNNTMTVYTLSKENKAVNEVKQETTKKTSEILDGVDRIMKKSTSARKWLYSIGAAVVLLLGYLEYNHINNKKKKINETNNTGN